MASKKKPMSLLEEMRHDAKLVEAERLERYRQEKLLGPLEYGPQTEEAKEKDQDLER